MTAVLFQGTKYFHHGGNVSLPTPLHSTPLMGEPISISGCLQARTAMDDNGRLSYSVTCKGGTTCLTCEHGPATFRDHFTLHSLGGPQKKNLKEEECHVCPHHVPRGVSASVGYLMAVLQGRRVRALACDADTWKGGFNVKRIMAPSLHAFT